MNNDSQNRSKNKREVELHRETKDVTEEAAVTLRNISTNFLSSLKYKKVKKSDVKHQY